MSDTRSERERERGWLRCGLVVDADVCSGVRRGEPIRFLALYLSGGTDVKSEEKTARAALGPALGVSDRLHELCGCITQLRNIA